MYDFYLGTKEEIERDEGRYLLAIKRMMPRWINSIPDTEFLALVKLLDEQGQRAQADGRSLVAVETGAGASSLALAFYAMKYGGVAYSWEMNMAKGSAIRQVAVETMGKHFGVLPDQHWKLVAFSSTSPHLGLPILADIADGVDLTFHDSEHTWQVLSEEVRTIIPMLRDGAVVAIDDGFLDYLHTNTAYINTFRRKLGLSDVTVADNTSQPFHLGVLELLEGAFATVEGLGDEYKAHLADDPWHAYYAAELEVNKTMGLIRDEEIEHRFDSWRVAGRR